ncbi:hypothetical protein PV325_001144 [Microctonus aethiopoides]|nr:hypothetical protein PV325_001144 [Microctonus aethiopoides]
MSMRRLAVLAAVQSNQSNGTIPTGGNYQYLPGYNMTTNADGKSGRFETNLHGNVNVLLGGAMLSGVIIVVVLVCYCCHKNMRKNRPREYSPYWRAEPDVQSLEVFTMDAHAMGHFFGAAPCDRIVNNDDIVPMSLQCPGTPGPPPPAYESLVFNPHNLPSPSDKKQEPLTNDANIPMTILTEDQSQEKCDDDDREDEGLPSYEAALKLEAHGYV